MIEALAAWLFAATWKGSLLLALALAVHALLRNRVASRWLYALLFVAMVRLLVPVAPSSPVSVFNLIPGRAEAPPPPAFHLQGGGVAARGFGVATAPVFVRARREASPLVIVLLALWAAGAQFALARQILRSIALRRALKNAVEVTSPVLDECRELLGVRRRVRLKITHAVDAPALHGWLRPAILLPSLLEPEPLRHVLLHELAHLQRHDVLANWILTVTRALQWFNPLVHLAVARLAEERELACDALALAQLRGVERSAYGGTVLQLLDQLRAPALVLVGMTTTQRQVKRRILMIARFKQRRSSSILFALILCAAAFVTLTDATADEPMRRQLFKKPLSPAAKAVMDRLDQNVTLTLDSVSVDDVVRLVANTAGTNVTIADGAIDDAARAAKISIKAENVPAHIVLMETLAAFELAVEFDDTGVQVVKGGPMLRRTAFAPGTPAEQKAHDEAFFTQKIARDHAVAGLAVQAESDDAKDGAIHRKVTFRGEGEEPAGTFELTVRKPQ